jgi:hypothetical protein
MMTVCIDKTLSPAFYEKIALFRHAIVLPEIALLDPFQPSIDQSTALLGHIDGQPQSRRGKNTPGLTDLR